MSNCDIDIGLHTMKDGVKLSIVKLAYFVGLLVASRMSLGLPMTNFINEVI